MSLESRSSTLDASSPPILATPSVTINDSNFPDNIRKGKSLGLLRELTSSWSSEPVCVKYSLKDDCDFVDPGGGKAECISVIPNDATQNGDSGMKMKSSASNAKPIISKNSSSSTPSSSSLGSCSVTSAISTSCDGDDFVKTKTTYDDNWIRKRLQLLRQCTEYLELESVSSKYTKDNFKKGFLNKVRIFYCFSAYLADCENFYCEWNKNDLTDLPDNSSLPINKTNFSPYTKEWKFYNYRQVRFDLRIIILHVIKMSVTVTSF